MTPRRAQTLIQALSSQRLALEPLLGTHAEHLFLILADPRTHRWIHPPKHPTVADLRAHWTLGESRCEATGLEARLAWALRRLHDGVYIGKIDANVSDIKWATNVGYILSPEVWGRGYATEAVGVVVEHLFSRGIRGCHAYVRPGNDASCRVLTRAAFEPAGMLLDELKFTRKAPNAGVSAR